MDISSHGPAPGLLLIWAGSVILLAGALVAASRRVRANLPKLLLAWRGEEGFAYSLSFILTIPFLMLIVALVIETTLLLAVHTGTFYAAYAGARSAIVWATAQPAGTSDTRVRIAVVHALMPFASGNPVHQEGLDSHVDADTRFAYMGLYHAYCPDGPLGDGYLLCKLVYAHHALALHFEPPAKWDSPITATVRYEHPFHWQIIGRALGHPAPWGSPYYTYTVQASVTLQNEGAKNKAQSLGIRYDSTY
jgi:hypothetical protein